MSRQRLNLRRKVGLAVVVLVLLIWTLLPIYHMLMISVSPFGEVFKPHLWPKHPTLSGFWTVLTQDNYNVSRFWRQLYNSFFVAVISTVGVLIIGTLTSYAIGRLRPRWGGSLSNVALATYVIPLSFMAIPLYKVMAFYNLLNTEWSLVFALIAFASPYAIWVFTQHAQSSIPREIDESARVDGANAWSIYFRIYLPLMAPVLIAIGTYAFLLAWNEYLLAFLLLNSESAMTLPVALGSFLNTDQVPWNLLMATSLFYALPPVILYYVFGKYVTTGLTAGGVKT